MNEVYRVLVVDDLLVNTKILEKILVAKGFECVLAFSGEEALEKVHEHQFHCILLDIIMPGIDGFEVIRRLKKIPVICEIPVIFITGEEGPEATVRGFEAGAVDYITKPFYPPEVQVRVRSHIKMYMTIHSLAQAQAETLKQINNAQNALLKNPSDIPGANFSVYYQSLHAAGGDIYDILEISDTKYGYFVGDFAGHQISTGFLTSSVKALLQQNCSELLSPMESMSMVNTVLCQLMKPGQYLTACYAVLDIESFELTVVNMGHPPLLVKQNGGKVIEMGKGGDVLGVFEDALYREDKTILIPGDRFFLYTDGLIEGDAVWSAAIDPLKNIVTQSGIADREEFLEDLILQTTTLRGDIADDIMVLVCDVPGSIPVVKKADNEFRLDIAFPSVRRFINQYVNELNSWIINRITVKDTYGLKLILHEVVSNAVIHGNESDVSKMVRVTVQIESDEYMITVEDQGNGFDWRKGLGKKIDMSNTKAYSGRGRPLLDAYNFNVEYNEKGNITYLKQEY